MSKINILNFVVLALLLYKASFLYSNVPDSLFIEKTLKKSYSMDFSTNEEKLLFFAGAFQGVPYGVGTLEHSAVEQLVVRTDSLDCTTFVETVTALFLASKINSSDYSDFCNSLRYVRYRDGVIDGYSSRLHYFSDWVSDNVRKGILYEVTDDMDHRTRKLSLDYMTSHKEAYKQLRDNPENISRMRDIESLWSEYEMTYIPKEHLDKGKTELCIDNGDIIALTTDIEGLDVVHLGFAYWIDDELHLLHASSLKNRVVLDEESLYHYLMKRKRHTGIRVIRIN